jgi:hypothetical protein
MLTPNSAAEVISIYATDHTPAAIWRTTVGAKGNLLKESPDKSLRRP